MEKTFQNSNVSAVNSPPTIYQETWLPIFEALSWVKRHQANHSSWEPVSAVESQFKVQVDCW